MLYRKQKGFVWVSQYMLAVLLFVVMSAGLAYYGVHMIDAMKAQTMETSVNMVGRALVKYAESHRQIRSKDIKYMPDDPKDKTGSKHLYAPTTPLYPKDEEEFRAIRDELGYFVQFNMNEQVDEEIFDKIQYTANADRTDFTLEATFPNGKKYTVTKKDFFDNGRADPE